MLKELVKYRFKQYLKTSKVAMPLLVLVAVQYVLYSMIPVGVVESFVLSCIYIFLIMVWVSLGASDLEDPVSEQIIILRIQSEVKYYLSQILFLASLSAAAAFLAVLAPVLLNLVNHNQVFIRSLAPPDIICSYMLLWASAFLGSSLGDFFPARIMKDRKSAILLTLLITIISVAKVSILDTLPLPALLLCFVPPMSEVFTIFGQDEYFQIGKVALGVVVLFGYGCAMAAIKVWFLMKNKF